MRWRLALGLRARLVLALLATSALTLAVAALALLAPLERRLRADELEALRADARVVAQVLAATPRSTLRPGDVQLGAVVRRAAGRVDAQIIVVDAHGRLFASTRPSVRDRPADAVRALRMRRAVGRVVGEGRSAEARYALRIMSRPPLGVLVFRRLDEAHVATRTVGKAMLVAALAGLVTALLTGLAVSSRLLRRLRELRDTALRVARLGPVVEVARERARDEVGDLSRAFATMQDRLREQEEARRTFVSTASHELRTPLASLRLMLELAREELEREPANVDGARSEVARAERQSERLAVLAEQLLDLSRIDAGVPLQLAPVDAARTAAIVAGEFADRALRDDRRIEIAAPAPAWALADADAVAQITRILLDNALRFAPPRTPIEVAAAARPQACVIAVRDRGPGIPAQERDAVFERFRRGASTGGAGGFGLGLAIARELARHMGGDLVLSEASPGACFELRLAVPPGDSVRSGSS